MGKDYCDICGNKIGFLSKNKLKNGIICFECIKDYDKNIRVFSDLFTVEQIKQSKNGKLELLPPIKFQCNPVGILIVDRMTKVIYMEALFVKMTDVVPFESVKGYSYVEDEKSYGVGHVIGKVAVGKLLFGNVGAIIGSVVGLNPKRLVKKIVVEIYYEVNGVAKTFDVNIYKGKPVKITSLEYSTGLSNAKLLMAQLDLLISKKEAEVISISNEETAGVGKPISNADEIRKYKELFDDGIISEEEYIKKKQDLLGF